MYKRILNKITNIEKTYNVDEIQLKDGTKLWNLIRILLSHYSVNKDIIQDEKSNKIKKGLFLLKESLTPHRLPKQVSICSVSDVDAQRVYRGIHYDPYVDPLNEIFDNYYVLDWPSQKGLRHKDVLQNHINLNIPLSVLVAKIKPPKRLIPNKVLLDKVIGDFALYFNIDQRELTRHIYESIGIFVVSKKHTKKIFDKMAPSLVFIRAGAGRFQMAVVQACKELNIKTIELQHGLMFQDQVCYIKKIKSTNRDCLPDEIYTWGAFFSNIIKSGCLFPEKSIHEVGFPFMEKMVNESPDQDDRPKIFTKRFKSIVLVAGQKTGNIDEFVRQSASLNEDIGYIFKPHPRDIKEYVFSEKNIMVLDRRTNYYSLLPYADVNMTVSSTTMFESICFGVPNIVVYRKGANISGLGDIVDNKITYLVKRPNDLPALIKKIKNIPKTKIKEKSTLYFENNPLQLIKTAVDNTTH